MKLPLKWLKEYVDFNVTVDEFIEKMMWRGFEVASVEKELAEVERVVVGRLAGLTKHPDADKLQVCAIDVGSGETLSIVTGAQNVFEGALVPVALDGSRLAGGLTITETVMRGVKSAGMLCSGKELGITEADYKGAEAHGILLLEGDIVPGTPIETALGMDDIIFDIEITPNRPDCQSILGMCREVASALGQKFREPTIKEIVGGGNAEDYAKVTVLNTELCPRYTARVVVDLHIAPSPAWMQKKLKAVGLRPINNIVDITNLVMVEYGHPMHAFDLACVENGHIVVRNAFENEVVVTLDSKARPVTPDMLLIADPKKGVGIAGVMGGENSEIMEQTKATLFESAVFKGSNIRSTVRKLKHTTDAAARFIKGVEAVNAKLASDRAIELVVELNAGRVVGGAIDACAASLEDRVAVIDCGRVNRILHTAFTPREMAEMLSTLNMEAKVEGEALRLTIPHYRTDIAADIEADANVAEELARVYGYYNIAPKLMDGATFCGRLTPDIKGEDEIKDIAVGMGCYEMYNYNFTGPNALDALLLEAGSEKRKAVKLLNPFGEEQSLMRTTLYMGMLDAVALNCGRKTGHGRFFEVGNAHFDLGTELPEERKLLGFAFTGADEDFFTLKGTVEELLDRLGADNARFIKGGGEYFHPGQKALISAGGEVIGELGTVHPKVQKAYGIPQAVYVAELNVEKLLKHRNTKKTYAPIPRFPSVERDIAVVTDEAVLSTDAVNAILLADAGVIVSDARLFDVYRGAGVPEGKKSMAFSFSLRAEDRTLTDAEIRAAMDSILVSLEAKTGAKLRG
ncbi:MAG: phenylalanine--tRNA ligase subunit beta [Clostridiaceae bacterium]|nr:phenylalanine--tRNA ligase subunit beta [Eubacteriales bacterium]